MSSLYTTEDLLRILAIERRACLKGERLNLSVAKVGLNPVLDPLVNTEGLQKFTAYLDFRQQIHRYQVEHQISGIVWRQFRLGDQLLNFPEISDQLVALPEDLVLLKNAKQEILAFWQQVTSAFSLYLLVNYGREHQRLGRREVDRLADRSDWASLSRYGYGDRLEIVLQLGWGNPHEALGRRGWPASGSEFICGVQTGQPPLFRL